LSVSPFVSQYKPKPILINFGVGIKETAHPFCCKKVVQGERPGVESSYENAKVYADEVESTNISVYAELILELSMNSTTL
jgi:hypothetical protein